MSHHLMKEDGQEVATPPKASTTPKKKEATQGVMYPVNDGITWAPFSDFPGDDRPGASCDNPVHLSDAMDASV